MTLTKHQRALLALIRIYGPVIVQSRNPGSKGPQFMLDGTIWANPAAADALTYKGFTIVEDGKLRLRKPEEEKQVPRRYGGGLSTPY